MQHLHEPNALPLQRRQYQQRRGAAIPSGIASTGCLSGIASTRCPSGIATRRRSAGPLVGRGGAVGRVVKGK